MICEKRSLPADKACGEGVMPTGVSSLERLGVKQHLRKFFAFEGIRYISPKGVTAQAPFHEGAGLGIPRLELSRALSQQAMRFDCLEICTGVCATSIRREENQYLSVKVGKDRIRTRLLVGADGLHSVVRRWSGLEGPKGNQARWGIRQHFQMTPWSGEVEVYWSNGIEAYITPCGENLVGVAFLWDQKRHPHLPGGKQLFPALLKSFPALQERLQNRPACDAALALGPMQRKAIRPVADGVLLVGDAAGYLDALTGEGISLALAQALSLEETVIPLLLASRQKGMLSATDLSSYKRAYQVITRPYYQMTYFALWLSRHPFLVEWAIRLLRRKPPLFQSLLSANMGVIPLWQVPYFAMANAIAPRRAVS
jgi:flavin-dependent dehydrogenase